MFVTKPEFILLIVAACDEDPSLAAELQRVLAALLRRRGATRAQWAQSAELVWDSLDEVVSVARTGLDS